jgi:hypothetical protein
VGFPGRCSPTVSFSCRIFINEKTTIIGLQTFGFLSNRTPKIFSSQIGLQRISLFYYMIVALFNQFWNIEIHVFYCIDQATLVLLFWIDRT